MTTRDYIIAPKTLKVEVALESVYAQLDSLIMLNEVEEYEGLDPWLYRMAATLDPDLLERNRLVFQGFGGMFYRMERTWDSILDLAKAIEQLDPNLLRDQIVDNFYFWCEKKGKIGPETPSKQNLLQDEETFINLMRILGEDHDVEKEVEVARKIYPYLIDPPTMQALIVNHLRDMWEQVLAPEWKRITPMLVDSMEALQRLDFSGLSGMEAIKLITGRDMSASWFAEAIENAQHIIFVPCPHIGPYLSIVHGEQILRIKFRARLPEGSLEQSPSLNRSELLVRFSALTDDTRLQILELMGKHRELCSQDIMEMLNLSQSATSRHLRQLTATGFLTERRVEGAKCYSLNPERVESTLTALRKFVSIG